VYRGYNNGSTFRPPMMNDPENIACARHPLYVINHVLARHNQYQKSRERDEVKQAQAMDGSRARSNVSRNIAALIGFAGNCVIIYGSVAFLRSWYCVQAVAQLVISCNCSTAYTW